MAIITRNLSIDELQLLLSWAASEGWNPGIEDHTAFYNVDPDGFFGVFDNDRLISGISMVKPAENSNYAFLGLYICDPADRGKGFGIQVWRDAMDYAKDCVIALDGVVEQQSNYKKSGFELAYRNIRYHGSTEELLGESTITNSTVDIVKPTAEDTTQLVHMDEQYGGVFRARYLEQWLQSSKTRMSVIARNSVTSEHLGFGTIRTCQEHFKVGPLLANSTETAVALVAALCRTVGAAAFTIDIPEPNESALSQFDRLNLTPIFETARMYRGEPPTQQLDKIYGVASLELG